MSRKQLIESVVEDATLAWLERLGWMAKRGPEIAAGEPVVKRIMGLSL